MSIKHIKHMITTGVTTTITSTLLGLTPISAADTTDPHNPPAAGPRATSGTPIFRVNPQQPGTIYFIIRDKPLGEVLAEVSNRSGITFKLAGDLNQDKVLDKKMIGRTWEEALKPLMAGYNYSVVGEGAKWKAVTVSGRNGDAAGQAGPGRTSEGRSDGESKGDLLTYAPLAVKDLPDHLKRLNLGSVMSVKLPMNTLKALKKGDKVTVDLPIGQYEIIHDNRFNHEGDSMTWVGYLANEGVGYRAMITDGPVGPMGHIMTPDGVYQIETLKNQTYLIDVNASGMKQGSLENDQLDPATFQNIPQGKQGQPNPASTPQ